MMAFASCAQNKVGFVAIAEKERGWADFHTFKLIVSGKDSTSKPLVLLAPLVYFAATAGIIPASLDRPGLLSFSVGAEDGAC